MRIALTTADGKSWSRVHVIEEPLSEYLRYELIGYVESMAVGEEIRRAYPLRGRALVVFWLIDAGTPGAFAVLMRYNDDGVILGYERLRGSRCDHIPRSVDRELTVPVTSVIDTVHPARQAGGTHE